MNEPLSPRTDLTVQQKNLARLRPLGELDSQRHRANLAVMKKLDFTPDLRSIALAILNFVMEQSAFQIGADPEQMIEAGCREAMRLHRQIDEELARDLSRHVAEFLRNGKDGFKEFIGEYYDYGRDIPSFFNYRYLLLATDPENDDRAVARLGEAAQLVFLGMLEIDDSFLQEAELIIMQKAIERGRFDDALMVAQNARRRSITLKVAIETKLLRARRAIETIRWTEDMLPDLQKAAQHISERITIENLIMSGIDEKLDVVRNDPATREITVTLRNTLEDCRSRHSDLHRTLLSAVNSFSDALRKTFRRKVIADCKNPETDILEPLLTMGLDVSSAHADTIVSAQSVPRVNSLFDMRIVFEQALTERAPSIQPEDDTKIVTITEIPPLFGPTAGNIRTWFLDVIAKNDGIAIDAVLDLAYNAGFSREDMRCVILTCLHALSEESFPMVSSFRAGRYTWGEFSGDNIAYTLEKAA